MAEPEQEEIVEEPAVVVLEKRYGATLPRSVIWVKSEDDLPNPFNYAEGSYAIISEAHPVYDEENKAWVPDPNSLSFTLLVDNAKGWTISTEQDNCKVFFIELVRFGDTGDYAPMTEETYNRMLEELGNGKVVVLRLWWDGVCLYYYAEPKYDSRENVLGYYFCNGRKTLLVGTDFSITEVNE